MRVEVTEGTGDVAQLHKHLSSKPKVLSLVTGTKNKTKQSKTSQRKATSGSLSMVSQLSGQHASKDSFSMCDSRKQRAKG